MDSIHRTHFSYAANFPGIICQSFAGKKVHRDVGSGLPRAANPIFKLFALMDKFVTLIAGYDQRRLRIMYDFSNNFPC